MSAESSIPHVLIEWDVCERVAITVAGGASEVPRIDQADIDRAADRTIELVSDYTGLNADGALPSPEAVDRAEWVRANANAIHAMAGELEQRLSGSLGSGGPLAPLTRSVVGIAAGVELGLALGYLARKVLGQYEVALVGPARPPRLMFVAPNLAEAHERFGGDRELLLRWIALHESTHALQFSAVPWLRPHLGLMIEELIGSSAPLRLTLGGIGSAARRLIPPDPRRLAEEFRDGGLVALVGGSDQARLMRRIQATMAVIEGYSEHVMDAVGDRLDPRYAELRDRIEEQRDRRGRLDAIVGRLLGLDMKMRQYRLGKAFADRVTGRVGIDGLNHVWSAPEAMPSSNELADPDSWLDRVGVGATL